MVLLIIHVGLSIKDTAYQKLTVKGGGGGRPKFLGKLSLGMGFTKKSPTHRGNFW